MAQEERTRRFIGVLLYFVVVSVCHGLDIEAAVHGFRVDASDSSAIGENGKIMLFANMDVQIRLFGVGFGQAQQSQLSFTRKRGHPNEDCTDLRSTDIFPLIPEYKSNTTAVAIVNLPLITATESDDSVEDFYMLCMKASSDAQLKHQGDVHWLQVYMTDKPVDSTIMPIAIQSILIVFLLAFSGLFSGLNLGLMALDQTELKILSNCGSKREKRYAKRIAPLRKRGNFLLCTILLGNVLVNNTLTILLDDLSGSGYAAVLGATAAIVIFGEIIPQAVCSRYGLAIGANTIWFTKFFMLITFPLSFPISKMLDWILGEEMGSVYNRDRLRELLRLTKTDLINDEVNIITGALQLSKKRVADIMTQLEDVYMININSVLDFDTMNDIMRTGYTRIPVYDTDNTNIVGILNIKDLAFNDPDDKTPLRTICEFYKHPVAYVFEDIKLSEILQQFKEGKSHMAFVRTVHNEGPGDPFYETLGVVTLEDVIEEIIQSEIVDETDTITDNRKRAQREGKVRDFSIFSKPDEREGLNFPKMSPQLALATYQYLQTSVESFKVEQISDMVLQRLIKQNIVHEIQVKCPKKPAFFIYQAGKKCDYFVLVLQGRVEVCIGRDQMTFESGPFTYFGVQALTGMVGSQSLTSLANNMANGTMDLSHTKYPYYTPDFTVKVASDYLQYIQIRRQHYEAARRATAMERMMKREGVDHFAKEWTRITSGLQDNVSIKTEGDSVAATPDKSDSSLMESKETPTSPISVVIDVGMRQRSSTQGSQEGRATPPIHGDSLVAPLCGAGEEEKMGSALTPLIQNCDDIPDKSSLQDEAPC